jgi:integrase
MGNKNKLPDMLTKEQVLKLFECIDRPKCAIACFLALTCGLRIREVCRIEINDVDLQRRIIKIRDSKNPNRKKNQGYGKDRIVPIPQISLSPIKKWLSIIEGGKWLLPSAKSQDMHLRTKTLHRWFSEAREKAGLSYVGYVVKYKKKVNSRESSPVYKFRFHGLRHFYAQTIYDKTRDLYAVANLLGHNQITTTQIYAKVSDKQMKESVDFAFNIPIKTRIFEQNPVNALNYTIPEVAKREKNALEILEERFAKGELSDIEFANKLRLLKLKRDMEKEQYIET